MTGLMMMISRSERYCQFVASLLIIISASISVHDMVAPRNHYRHDARHFDDNGCARKLSPIGIKEPGMIGVMEPVLGS